MFTLSQILSENPVPSSDMAHIQFAANCSPFVARLLNKDATLLADLLQNLTQAYQYEHMQMFLDVKINQLNNQKIDVDDANQTQLNTHLDEITLKRLLRQLRQSVMARMIVRDLNQLADDIPSQLADDELSHLTNNTKVNKSLANLNEVMQTTSNLAEIS